MAAGTELPSACAIACPTGTANLLQSWGEQYVPPHQWLFGDRELGGFSADAVRTVTTHYEVTHPAHARYGLLRDVIAPDQLKLNIMQTKMTRKGLIDNHIGPDDVQLLQRQIQARESAVERFAHLPDDHREKMAAGARPFLEKVAMSLIELDTDFADLEDVAAILAAREVTSPELIFARDFINSMNSVTQAHMFDQGPFMVAKQASEACEGPWSSNARVGIVNRLTGLGRKIGQVCPIAAERNTKYFHAQAVAQQQREHY